MKRYSADHLVSMSLNMDPRTINDRIFHLAWCWEIEEFGFPIKEDSLIYRFKKLLLQSDPFTIERQRERYLENHKALKEKYVSTNWLRAKLIGGQESLWHE